MKYLSLSVSTDDISSGLYGDGDVLADLFNEIALHGPLSERVAKEFAEHLDSDGRGLLKQLGDAVSADDAEEGVDRPKQLLGAANHEELLTAAKEVMELLQECGPSIVPHLLDTDQNAGQRLRSAIAKAEGR